MRAGASTTPDSTDDDNDDDSDSADWQMIKVSLSCEARHDAWFSYSAASVRRSEAVASRIAWMVGVSYDYLGTYLPDEEMACG